MTDTSIDLASLLCSRLCHDLLSPVGAMSNGLELLVSERDPEMRKRCMERLEQSAKTSADKLKFFRLAFGGASGFNYSVPVAEPREVIDALVAGNDRISINWALRVETLPKPAVKVMLNLALIGIEALVRGGTLDIGVESRGGASEIVVRAAGPKIAFDPTIGQALDGSLPIADLSSRTAPAWMLNQLAAQQGGGLQFALTPEALVMGAVLPEG